jgi:hypothetical protein
LVLRIDGLHVAEAGMSGAALGSRESQPNEAAEEVNDMDLLHQEYIFFSFSRQPIN